MAVTRSRGDVMEEEEYVIYVAEEAEHVMWRRRWRRRWRRTEAKEKSCSPDSSASSGGLTGPH